MAFSIIQPTYFSFPVYFEFDAKFDPPSTGGFWDVSSPWDNLAFAKGYDHTMNPTRVFILREGEATLYATEGHTGLHDTKRLMGTKSNCDDCDCDCNSGGGNTSCQKPASTPNSVSVGQDFGVTLDAGCTRIRTMDGELNLCFYRTNGTQQPPAGLPMGSGGGVGGRLDLYRQLEVTYFSFSSAPMGIVSEGNGNQIVYKVGFNAGDGRPVPPVEDSLLTYPYDPINRWIETRPNRDTYEYNLQRQLVRKTTLAGAYFEYFYNGSNNLERITGDFPGCVYFEYASGAVSRIVQGALPLGDAERAWSYDYQTLSGPGKTLTKITGPEGCTTYFGFDSGGRILKEVDAENYTTYFEYDASSGQIARFVQPEGPPTLFERPMNGSLKKYVAEPAQTTYYVHDERFPRITQNILGTAGGTPEQTFFDDKADTIATIDRLGRASYFAYDASHNPIRHLDPLQASAYFDYNIYNRQTRAVGKRWTETGSQASFTTYFEYDPHNLIRKVDALGNATTMAWQRGGLMVKSRDPRGNATYYDYDAYGRQTRVLDALQNATYFGYDSFGNQTRSVSPRWKEAAALAPFTSYFEYDQRDRQVRAVDAEGNITERDYSARCEQEPIAEYQLVSGTWRATYFVYDGLARQVRRHDPVGNSETTAYVGATTLVARQGDKRGFGTYFAYDGEQRATAQQDAVGNSVYFGYDAVSNRTRTVGARWRELGGFGAVASYFGYDALDRQVRTLNPLGQSAYFAFDADGNRTREVNPRWTESSQQAFTTYYQYDRMNRQASMLDANGIRSYFEYDANGNQTRVVTAIAGYGVQGYGNTPYGGSDGHAMVMGYDALNRLARTGDAEGGGTYFGYDAAGNQTRVQDALFRTTYFAYDRINRLTSVTDALPASVYFAYDQASNRTIETDALFHSTYFAYDALNRLTRVTDPLGKSAYYGYDASSNLAKTLDNNGTAVYFGYDGLNRRTRIQYPTSTQYFEFDADSDLTRMLDGWGISTFAYDVLNRLVKRATPNAEAVYYAYDAASNLTRVQYPKGTSAAYYAFDPGQRMTRVKSPDLKNTYFEYDAANNIAKKTFGNGVVCDYTYDAAERVTAIRHVKGAAPVAYFEYGRDGSGRIVKLARETDLAIYYSYDSIDRLTAEVWRRRSDHGQIYGFFYAYDNVGNRLKQRREFAAGTEWDSAYFAYADDNSLTRKRTQTPPSTFVNTYYYYDANGALTKSWEMGGVTATYFEYGPNQLVTKVAPPAAEGNPWLFSYDGQLNRYKIDRGGTVRYYLWDGLNNLEERDNAGTLVARYTHGYSPIEGIGTVCEVYLGSPHNKSYSLAFDHRGTAYVLLDDTGMEVGRRYYDAFGVILGQTGDWPVDLGYQTNWLTVQIGTKWWGLSAARMYEYETGAFIQRDLLPNALKIVATKSRRGIYRETVLEKSILPGMRMLDPNLYIYSENIVTSWVDPVGLYCGPGIADFLIPDKSPPILPQSYDFTEFCKAHDDCYGTCKNKSRDWKAKCDEDFCSRARNYCFRHNEGTWKRRDCDSAAETYCAEIKAVIGDYAFERAQEKACKEGCLNGPPKCSVRNC